jgi:Fic family protein
MTVELLRQSPVGRLVSIKGYDPRFEEDYDTEAFVPEPLPAVVPLSPATYTLVADAAAAVGRADQAAYLLPNPALLTRPSIRREAVSTSALEGTYTAFTDVLEADFLDEDELSSSVSEVVNYVRAAEDALAWIAEGRPITVALLCELQSMIVRGTRGDTPDSGRVRSTQVFIGADRRRVTEARFVPPPPGDLLRDGVEAWESWVRTGNDLHVLVRMALAHYQFETLHPFVDGNGRLGRLIAILQLVQEGHLRVPILNLSPWLESRRDQYQDHLLAVSQSGDFEAWVAFFCAAVRAQALEAVSRIHRLLELKDRMRQRLRKARAKGTALLIAEDLIGYPMLTVTLAHQRYGVSYQAANTAVSRLVDLGILRQRNEGRYDRIFSADDVLRIIEL